MNISKPSLSPKSAVERRRLLKRSDLLESELKLVELMEDLKFGRIERLQFRGGGQYCNLCRA